MKAPWHIAVIGALSLFWNAIGALDFTLTAWRDPRWMGQFTAGQLAFLYGFPHWAMWAWGCAAWVAVLGSILLLWRSALALWAFVAAVLGALGALAYRLGLSAVPLTEAPGLGAPAFTAMGFAVPVALLVYARQMKMQGVLR